MTYDSPHALRTALEQRLRNRSAESDIPLDRLRRRVIFERIVARLDRAEPSKWVLKGGMALEVRLGDDARLTKDVDLGLRETTADAPALRERFIDALDEDLDGDGFVFVVGPVEQMAEDGAGHLSWRAPVQVSLAGRSFGAIKVDISPRPHELETTDRLTIPSALDFAGAEPVDIEVVDIHRHAAEKLHAMLLDFGERENSRVRDLIDLMLLLEHELLDPAVLAKTVTDVWNERDAMPPLQRFPALPEGWPARYERLAAEHDVDPPSFSDACARAAALWLEMFPAQET
jgi:Nucleotidyl transferase AbiEii toxin, Type IV TA system